MCVCDVTHECQRCASVNDWFSISIRPSAVLWLALAALSTLLPTYRRLGVCLPRLTRSSLLCHVLSCMIAAMFLHYIAVRCCNDMLRFCCCFPVPHVFATALTQFCFVEFICLQNLLLLTFLPHDLISTSPHHPAYNLETSR